MWELHCVPCNTANGITDIYVMYCISEGHDLRQSIHDAMVEYCYNKYQEQPDSSITTLDYGEFIRFVPNELCKKHGFSKIVINENAEAHSTDEIRVDIPEMSHIISLMNREANRSNAQREAAREQEKIREIAFYKFSQKVAASLKRENSRFSDVPVDCIMRHAYDWAKEYVESGNTDINDTASMNRFFERKVDRLVRN
jgi:hypothetical protein